MGQAFLTRQNIIANGYMVTDAQVWSEEEKVVGVWTDGKPVYQKTIYTTTPSSTSAAIMATIADFETLVDCFGYIVSSANVSIPMAPINTSGPACTIYVGSIGNITLKPNSSYTNRPATITISYTKTTDTANSVIVCQPNIYSTSETVIGTWIDNKPIYRLCARDTTPNAASEATIDFSGYNIDECIDLRILIKGAASTKPAWLPLPKFNESSTALQGQYWLSTGHRLYYANLASGYQNTTAIVIIEYTKTTD